MPEEDHYAKSLWWGFCLGSCLQFPLRKYYYVDQLVTWPKAQQFCREHYTDLATFESLDDIKRLQPTISYSWAWIGLWDDPNAWQTAMGNKSNSWRWSATGETSKTGYRLWGTGDPDFRYSGEMCTFMDKAGYWYDDNCGVKHEFICYNELNVKQHVFIATPATWSDAQSYCRTHHTDLAMIENEAENSAVKQLIPVGVDVWFGLYRVPWSWSDKSPSLFRRWVSPEPDNYGGIQNCVCENTAHIGKNEHHCENDDDKRRRSDRSSRQRPGPPAGFCLGSCLQFPLRKYYYVNQSVTWPDAQQFCREHYTDLATFESLDDIKRLQPNISYSFAWIGLWDDPNAWQTAMGNKSNSWRWSSTGETSKTGYRSWATGEPNFIEGKETCVTIYAGKWYDKSCNMENSFACYTGENINILNFIGRLSPLQSCFCFYAVTELNVKQHVFIATPATWSDAQSYCRTHHTDLAMIENEAENSAVKQLIPVGVDVWIGLYRVPWSWSDKSPSLFRQWRPSEPNNYGGIQHCVWENTAHMWGDEKCNATKVFICEQVVKTSTTVKMTMTSDVDLTDPAVNAQVLQQLGALLTNQGWTDFKVKWKIVSKKNKEN
ncbi:macrophage mannose receptor 1-like [Xiphophorus hellerii]|uniref:macrophage mannose receptor 1-like n=1 Tax=Xiphophorus hellerii TaxID=8084 RepID=UPI0013B3921F|nr:macrophage mannose receptor 1-like [Xiphophorus hellerii]